MEHAPPSCFCVCVSVSDKTFKLKFKLQQLGSNFGDLYEQLLALWISETPDSGEAALILFGSCKHFESEFNPEGLKKMNSPHLIPHPELMKRGTLGFFFFPSRIWLSTLGFAERSNCKATCCWNCWISRICMLLTCVYWSADVVLMNVLALIMILSFYLCQLFILFYGRAAT